MTLKTAANDRKAASALLQITEQEAQVVDALRRQAAISRTDIARTTDWSRPKVTAVINRMIERGLLTEVGEGDSQGGRRPRLLRLNGQLGYVIGVDIGATSIDDIPGLPWRLASRWADGGRGDGGRPESAL